MNRVSITGLIANRLSPRLPHNTFRLRVAERHSCGAGKGMTLLELIIAASILLILSSAALPVLRFTIVRQKEAELHRDLRQIRDAIDRYKDYSDRGLIRVEAGSEGYAPDLDHLAKGTKYGAGQDQMIHFIRCIPMDHI